MDDWPILQEKVPSGIPNWPEWIVIPLCMLLITATVMWDVSQPPTIAGGIPYAAIVLIASFSGRARLTFLVAVLCIFLLVVGFYVSPFIDNAWESFINRAQTVAVIALLAGALIHRIRLMRQHEQALKRLTDAVERLKVLHGILPICSSCKKIKTDKGDWHQVESYIQAHSEAEFTHGICSECAQEMYGEFWDPEMDQQENHSADSRSP